MRKVKVTLYKVVNLGNYENVRIGTEIEDEVPDEDIQETREEMWKDCLTFILEKEKQINKLYSRKP